jgi:NAD+ synthase
MSIVNYEKTADYISNWIREYARSAGVKSLVLGLSGGIDSALVALLCKRTNIPLICVNMPCHSSPSAFNRAEAFAKDYDIPLYKVDLTIGAETVKLQFKQSEVITNITPDFDSDLSMASLRSGLRAPTLAYLAHAFSGIIMGTGNRSEDHITRYFAKIGDGCVDISPIADLFKSEVYDLFNFLASKDGVMLPGAQAIYDAKPTADLFGVDSGQEDEKELGIEFSEIEWADREDMRTEKRGSGILPDVPGIIFNEEDPAKHIAFIGYTARQKEVIAKMWHMQRATKHKENPGLPVCRVRSVEGLVK